jgi:hydroxymethylpyrimidine/phosphomethylpyrimidine kinase
MVAESGASLLDDSAQEALRTRLLPHVTVVTPNVPEAARLTGLSEDTPSDQLARAVHALGPTIAVVTGGHREQAVDLFFDGARAVEIPGERHPDGAAHGSGCTHSSALAAQLAWGHEPLEAAQRAKEIAAEAVRRGLRGVGAGAGPVDAIGLGDRGD